jgi:type IV pilus assembly protein PilX
MLTKSICIINPGDTAAQKGAALIVSLIFLMVTSLLGVHAMESTTLEEKMAAHQRDRNVALQSAEAGLRAAEAYIESLVTIGGFTGSHGLYGINDTEPDHLDYATWNTTSSVAATAPYGSASSRYFIKHRGVITGVQGAMNLSGYGGNKGTGDVTTFRITARGAGAGAAEVMLVSHFGRNM